MSEVKEGRGREVKKAGRSRGGEIAYYLNRGVELVDCRNHLIRWNNTFSFLFVAKMITECR